MQFHTWLSTSLTRVFPQSRPGTAKRLEVWAARGERVAFQVCGRQDCGLALPLTVAVKGASAGVSLRVRRVGCVPVAHHNDWVFADSREGNLPGFVPDVLIDGSETRAASEESTAFWVTVEVARNARPGRRRLAVELTVGKDHTFRRARLTVDLQVSPVVVERRKNFRVTHWFYADAIADWYKVAPFSKAFWPLCAKFMRNFAEHGSDTIYVPIFTPPLDGVKTPTQLVHVTRVGKDRYKFGWSQVKQWIATAKKAGITHFEWAHLFTQWGVKNALRIYHGHGQGADEKLLWPVETGATSPTYRKFLAQFLPELKRFIEREGLMGRSFFHVSDEPHGDEALTNYRAARQLLRELAPWMRVMDALSDIRFGREQLTDLPIPVIKTALQFKAEGIPSWCYYCCSPGGRFTNRFMDTPLANVRAQGWLFYRHGFGGFLHWGFNYWYKRQSRTLIDPFTVSDGGAWPGWTYGDPFVVYPAGKPAGEPEAGPGASGCVGIGWEARRLEPGPLDSIRWEVFHETLQDYALLETLGVPPEDPRLKAFKTFEAFPRDAKVVLGLRKALLKRGDVSNDRFREALNAVMRKHAGALRRLAD
ncbi:MAG TPA: DUF4091 domain-containing protein [Planctomycetota bacterium]|nr:DUF4091 domain-containing protein [Planctomycetota bacterium]